MNRVLFLAFVLSACLTSAIHADIPCFCDFSDFTFTESDNTRPAVLVPGGIEITGTGGGEKRSLFYNEKQDITAFTAEFTFQVSDGRTDFDFHPWTTFVIHDNPIGVNASEPRGLSKGSAVLFQLSGGDDSDTAFFTGGASAGQASTSPLNLQTHNPIDVSLTYDGSILNQRMVDSVTGDTFEQSYLVDLEEELGSPSGYVGFIAASTNDTSHRQIISDFKFAAVPEPASCMLAVIGILPFLTCRKRRLRGS